MGVGLFQVINNRTRGKNLELLQGKFRLDTKKYFFTERIAKHWNDLLREIVEKHPCRKFTDTQT